MEGEGAHRGQAPKHGRGGAPRASPLQQALVGPCRRKSKAPRSCSTWRLRGCGGAGVEPPREKIDPDTNEC
jgi:hypothetical protein